MYDAGENKGLLLKAANSKRKKMLWIKAMEFQCHWQKCSGVGATITYKWPFYYHTI